MNREAIKTEISLPAIAPININIITRHTKRALPVASDIPDETKTLLFESFFIADSSRITSEESAL